jgi:undecaprenyl pyrophosphate phosphatase UppP
MKVREGIRWTFRLAVPAAMVLWGAYELLIIWRSGWLWTGYWSTIAFFVAVFGAAWLVEELRELWSHHTALALAAVAFLLGFGIVLMGPSWPG